MGSRENSASIIVCGPNAPWPKAIRPLGGKRPRILYRITLRGDSMLSKYKSGDVIEFRMVNPQRHRFVPGKDYTITLRHGKHFFLRLRTATRGKMVFGCINRKMRRQRLRIDRSSIERCGVPVGILVPA